MVTVSCKHICTSNINTFFDSSRLSVFDGMKCLKQIGSQAKTESVYEKHIESLGCVAVMTINAMNSLMYVGMQQCVHIAKLS